MATIIDLEIKQNSALSTLAVFIQCTWVRAYLTPAAIKLNCILSYDRTHLPANKPFATFEWITDFVKKIVVKQNQIGVLTGNYVVTEKDVIWLEMVLLNCNRKYSGWVRERDVWHALKGCEPNELDWPYIPYKQPNPNNPDIEKKSSLTAWLMAALGLLSALK